MNNMAPDYVSDMLTEHTSTLRGERDVKMLQFPANKEKTIYYQMCFHWNSLPLDIRCAQTLAQFKSKLKTHYLNEAYCSISSDSDTDIIDDI